MSKIESAHSLQYYMLLQELKEEVVICQKRIVELTKNQLDKQIAHLPSKVNDWDNAYAYLDNKL